MLAKYFQSSSRILEIQSRPNGKLIEDFAFALGRDGYSKTAGCHHLRSAEHFLYWAHEAKISFTDFSKVTVERFAEHLETCQCYGPRRASQAGTLYSVQLFLELGIGHEPGALSAVTLERQGSGLFPQFCQWMRLHRGTGELTLYNYGNSLRRFLVVLGEDAGKLDAQTLRQFVLEESGLKGSKAAQRCTTSLRMFIRFLVAEGKCSGSLLEAVPVVAHWRLSSLPKYLQPEEVESVINSCNLNQSVGKRDRAILLLLARYGLRAGDVLRLRISDIDWKKASIVVSGKGRRETLLPLTEDVGQAIIEYLQHSRPKIETDTLFIRSRAPYRPFADHAAISMIVTRAMERVGITCPSRGAAHLLRHSVATSMLRNGVSLQDIAAVLRHRSISTTQIYAKVDMNSLLEISQMWPGELPC